MINPPKHLFGKTGRETNDFTNFKDFHEPPGLAHILEKRDTSWGISLGKSPEPLHGPAVHPSEGCRFQARSTQERVFSFASSCLFSWQTSQVPETLPRWRGKEMRGSRRGRGANEENRIIRKNERWSQNGYDLKPF